ncbi:Wzz/FepE/Etk N-terminal domain-containing protein [Thiohalospira sp.]|uniref:Wzz/FepE/Etk N-terminal domain-containing protein n=1 Tax=Thiohalospira sp. TaxID=3080549 RepID=UPI00397E9479
MAAQPPHEGPYADDEISLIDLWRVLTRRKHWIALAFVVTLVLASGWLALKTPIYEASATLEIGTADGSALESGGDLARRLENAQPEDLSPAREPVLTAADNEGRIMELTARGPSQQAADDFLKETMAEVQERHDGYLEEFRTEQDQRLDEITKRVQLMEVQRDEFENRLGRLDGDAAAIGGLLTLEQRLADRLPQLEKEQSKLRRSLSERVTGPTTVLVSPEPAAEDEAGEASPVEPRTRLVLALAAVLGLMLGVFVAFFREFLARVAEAGEEEAG